MASESDDWWSLGVILHELETRKKPFVNDKLTIDKNLDNFTAGSIRRLLNKDSIKINAIKDNRYFRGIDWTKLANKGINSPFVPKCNELDTSHEPLDLINIDQSV